jgi:hypothetical protein
MQDHLQFSGLDGFFCDAVYNHVALVSETRWIWKVAAMSQIMQFLKL